MHVKSKFKGLWRCGEAVLDFEGAPQFMGILNATPDSFSDGGQWLKLDSALHQASLLVTDGAAILDVGGESTRPGAPPVDAEIEKKRVIPVIDALHEIGAILSIDTTKASVARTALERGASIINDISGLTFDPEIVAVARDFRAGVIINHIQGTPRTMQQSPQYGDVVAEVRDWLKERIERLVDSGINESSICIDPGIGFGKTAAHNLALLHGIPELARLGRPLLIGHSRKRFLGKVLGRPVDERVHGTLGITCAAAELGADILRVHDVAANRDAWLAYDAVMRNRQPSDNLPSGSGTS